MALNISLLKKRQESASKDNNDRFKVSDTPQRVRILPDRDGDPLKKASIHYGIGGKTFRCPGGKSCAVCEYSWEVFNESYAPLRDNLRKENPGVQDKDLRDKHPALAEAYKTFRDTQPSERYFSLISCRNDKEFTPKWWGYPKSVYDGIIEKIFADLDETGEGAYDITDINTGLDLTVKHRDTGQRYKPVAATFSNKSTPLFKKGHPMEGVYETANSDFFDMMEDRIPVSFDEMYDLYNKKDTIDALQAHAEEMDKKSSSETSKYGGDSDEKVAGSLEELGKVFDDDDDE